MDWLLLIGAALTVLLLLAAAAWVAWDVLTED